MQLCVKKLHCYYYINANNILWVKKIIAVKIVLISSAR